MEKGLIVWFVQAEWAHLFLKENLPSFVSLIE